MSFLHIIRIGLLELGGGVERDANRSTLLFWNNFKTITELYAASVIGRFIQLSVGMIQQVRVPSRPAIIHPQTGVRTPKRKHSTVLHLPLDF